MIQIEREDDFGVMHHICLYTVADLSRVLNLKDNLNRPCGRNKLFKILKANHIITRDRQPAQILINLQIMEFHGVPKYGRTYYVCCFTEKGINYMVNAFKSGRYKIILDGEEQKKKFLNINEVF